MPRTLEIDGVSEFIAWVAYFTWVAENQVHAKEVSRVMPLLGGFLITNWEKLVSLSASGYPKLDRFTRTGGQLHVVRSHDGYKFIFKYCHTARKIQLLNLGKTVLWEFDNASSQYEVGQVVNDLLAGRIN